VFRSLVRGLVEEEVSFFRSCSHTCCSTGIVYGRGGWLSCVRLYGNVAEFLLGGWLIYDIVDARFLF